MVVPLVVLEILHRQEYWLSVSFAALFVGRCGVGIAVLVMFWTYLPRLR